MAKMVVFIIAPKIFRDEEYNLYCPGHFSECRSFEG